MRMIDADALKELVKKFQDDFPMTNARHYMCDVFLSMIDDVAQANKIDVIPDCSQERIGKAGDDNA